MGFDDRWSDLASRVQDVSRNGFPEWLSAEERTAIGDVAELVEWVRRWIDYKVGGQINPNPIADQVAANFANEAPELRKLVAAIKVNLAAIRAERSRLGWPDEAAGDELGTVGP